MVSDHRDHINDTKARISWCASVAVHYQIDALHPLPRGDDCPGSHHQHLDPCFLTPKFGPSSERWPTLLSIDQHALSAANTAASAGPRSARFCDYGSPTTGSSIGASSVAMTRYVNVPCQGCWRLNPCCGARALLARTERKGADRMAPATRSTRSQSCWPRCFPGVAPGQRAKCPDRHARLTGV